MLKTDITCHCGALAQSITIQIGDHAETEIPLCHCSTCRQVTGLLCGSYIPIAQPTKLDGTSRYTYIHHPDGRQATAYFCRVCGCHVFRQDTALGDEDNGDGSSIWEVATGILVGGGQSGLASPAAAVRFSGHLGMGDTRDGGLCVWLDPGKVESVTSQMDYQTIPEPAVLEAHCHCKQVSFHITRPDPSSSLPRSNFPDLMLPYGTTPQEVISNPDDSKWWLRPGGRYLAGTCACESCRLTSGFEVQTWTFVPKTNIFFAVPSEAEAGEKPDQGEPREAPRKEILPLGFRELHRRGVLQAYDSSVGVSREFCGRCGATVFWHDKWRPELIDVSAGLLDHASGARAEPWLDWWTDRVSFAEDADNGREGIFADSAVGLVARLESGLQTTKREK